MSDYHHLSLQHQEIKACAELLLELGRKPDLSLHEDAELVIKRLSELHHFSKTVCKPNTYHPLLDLKQYMEITQITYQDQQYKIASLPLSEALSRLNAMPTPESVLLKAMLEHFKDEMHPSRPLYANLRELCQH